MMLLKTSKAALAACCMLAVSGHVHATTMLIDDRFTDNDEAVSAGSIDPAEATWTYVDSGSFGADIANNQFEIALSGHTVVGTARSSATLSQVGDVISLTVDVRADGVISSTVFENDIINFKLFDQSGNGYVASVGLGTAFSGRFEAQTDPSHSLGASTTLAVSSDLGLALTTSGDTVTFSMKLLTGNDVELSFTSVSGVNVSTIVDHSSLPAPFTAAPTLTIDQVAFGFTPFNGTDGVNTPDKVFFDNVELVYTPVPEPASAALLGLGALLIAGGSRR